MGQFADGRGPAKPAAPGFPAYACICIVAQCGGQSAFIAGLNCNAVNGLVPLTLGQGALQRALFGQQSGKFGLGARDGYLGDVAGRYQLGPTSIGGVMCSDVILQLRLQCFDAGIGVAFGGSICGLISQNVAFGAHALAGLLCPLYARCRRRQRGICHAQFGIGARLLGRCIGQSNLTFTRLPLRIFRSAQQRRAFLLLRLNLVRKRYAFSL